MASEETLRRLLEDTIHNMWISLLTSAVMEEDGWECTLDLGGFFAEEFDLMITDRVGCWARRELCYYYRWSKDQLERFVNELNNCNYWSIEPIQAIFANNPSFIINALAYHHPQSDEGLWAICQDACLPRIYKEAIKEPKAAKVPDWVWYIVRENGLRETIENDWKNPSLDVNLRRMLWYVYREIEAHYSVGRSKEYDTWFTTKYRMP